MWPMATFLNCVDQIPGPTRVLKICPHVLCENKHYQLFLNTQIKNHRVNECFAGCGRMLESKG